MCKQVRCTSIVSFAVEGIYLEHNSDRWSRDCWQGWNNNSANIAFFKDCLWFRPTTRSIWPLFVLYMTILFPLQYVVYVGLPEEACLREFQLFIFMRIGTFCGSIRRGCEWSIHLYNVLVNLWFSFWSLTTLSVCETTKIFQKIFEISLIFWKVFGLIDRQWDSFPNRNLKYSFFSLPVVIALLRRRKELELWHLVYFAKLRCRLASGEPYSRPCRVVVGVLSGISL